MQEKKRNTRITRQSEHLNNSILSDEASAPDTHNSQNKKKGIKESRLPFGSAANGWPLVHLCPGGTCLLGTHGLDRTTSLTPLARPPCSPHSRPAARPRTRSQGSGVKQESHRTQLMNASSKTNMNMRRLSPRHVRSASLPHSSSSLFSLPLQQLPLLQLPNDSTLLHKNSTRTLKPTPAHTPRTGSASPFTLRAPPPFWASHPLSANRGRTRLLPSST